MSAKSEKISAIVENIKVESKSTPINAVVNSLTKEVKIVCKQLIIVSKKRLEFNDKGQKIPTGSRYILMENSRNRKIIFNPSEAQDLVKMIETSTAIGNFNFTILENDLISINYKLNTLTFDSLYLEWIVLGLTELCNIIKNIDKTE